MGEWWNGSRANRKSSPGNSAQPIDFRARNDQYPLGAARGRGRSVGGSTGGRTEGIHCFEGDGGRARVPAHRPAGRPAGASFGGSMRHCVPSAAASALFSPVFLDPSFLRFSVSLSLSYSFVARCAMRLSRRIPLGIFAAARSSRGRTLVRDMIRGRESHMGDRMYLRCFDVNKYEVSGN